MVRTLAARALLVALFIAAAGAARAEDPAPAQEPRIGKISFVRHDVFADDDRGVYHLANQIHITTREEYLRHELLFREGDVYDAETLEESERLLRSQIFLRQVKISTATGEGGAVDVTVETADVWTTAIRPSYGYAGGEQYYGLGVLESNFLGRGKQVGAFIFQDVDRRTSGVSYRDPALVGTRWTLDAGYGRDEKGREWATAIERPFFSPRIRNSVGAAVRVLDDEDRLFVENEEAANFQHRTRDARAFGAHALSALPTKVRRLTLAYERQQDDFSSLRFDPAAPINFPLPTPADDRVISAVLLGFDYRDLDFRKYTGLTTFDRVEDTNLGWEWSAEAGPSLKAFDATRDGLFGRAQVQKILAAGPWFVWFNHLDAEGRVESRTLRDGILTVRSEAFLNDWGDGNTSSLRAEWKASHNLDPESQFILGGDNGLRAYRFRETAGANTFLATLENRRVVWYDWLKLVNVGWAVFADAGTAWQRDERLRMGDMKTDFGAGLRISPTRSTDPGIIRIDVAYALQDNGGGSRLALNIGGDIHFGERQPRKFEQ